MPQSPLDTTSVKRPGAFFGRITRAVRALAAGRFDSAGGGLTLDVGCGNGLFFASLNARDARLVGADLDLDLLREAGQVFTDNRIANARLVQGDAGALPFPNGTFDNIFFLNTLINIPDDEIVRRLLEELMRLCRPGGRIFIDIRNRSNPYLRLKYWWHNRREDFPTRVYHLRQIGGVFASAGFRVVARHPVGPRFPFGAFAYLLEVRRPPAGGVSD